MKEVDDAQGAGSQRFSAWYNRSYRELRMVQQITKAFPEDGYVTAKTLEIRESDTITCTGNANNNQSYIALLDSLRAVDQIVDLKTESLRGVNPVQFALDIKWSEGGKANGN